MYTETIRYKLRVTERDQPSYDRPLFGGAYHNIIEARRELVDLEHNRDKRTHRPLYELVTITTREEVTETL